jgi:hypothetical protein
MLLQELTSERRGHEEESRSVQPGCISSVLRRLLKMCTLQLDSAEMQSKTLSDTRQQQQQQQRSLQQALSELRSLTISSTYIGPSIVTRVLGMLATSCPQLRRLVFKRSMYREWSKAFEILAAPETFPALQELSIELHAWGHAKVGEPSGDAATQQCVGLTTAVV